VRLQERPFATVETIQKQDWMYLRSFCLVAVSLPLLAQTPLGIPKPGAGISSLVRSDSAAMSYARPGEYSMDERVHDYMHSLFSPEAFGKTLLSTGWKEINGVPPEWGDGMSGFARTFGYKYLSRVTDKTITFGVAAMLHEDTRYFPSTEPGVWPRVKHAVVSTFIVPTEGGGSQFAFARFAGAFGSGAISNAWYPAGERGIGHTLKDGGWGIAGGIGGNLLKEFMPDVKRALAR